MDTKESLFKEIMDKYEEAVSTGKHTQGIEEYLAITGNVFNKRYYNSYPATTKKEDREDLLGFTYGGVRAYFKDRNLQILVEDLKKREIDGLDLMDFENHLSELAIDYMYTENRKVASGGLSVNPMNVFASSMYKEFIKEKMNKELIEGYRYTPTDIMDFYFYEHDGYIKVVSKIMTDMFCLLLKEKNYDYNNLDINVLPFHDGEIKLFAKVKGEDEGVEITSKFKDGYYHFWNDNDDRYVDVFELDYIYPDYREVLR